MSLANMQLVLSDTVANNYFVYYSCLVSVARFCCNLWKLNSDY